VPILQTIEHVAKSGDNQTGDVREQAGKKEKEIKGTANPNGRAGITSN